MLSEFDIIRQCFDQEGLSAPESEIVKAGIGDDCALLCIPAGKELAFSMDTLVADVHFPSSAEPALIGARALSVNLSDLAATGAEPCVFTLGITLPEADPDWLMAFAGGLKSVASRYNCALIGGNISRGPLVITVQVHGLVEKGHAILRSGASSGDKIFVTGSLGVAGLALKYILGELDGFSAEEAALLHNAYFQPLPRIEAGLALAPLVSAGIDISDGLLADLGHICQSSGAGAQITLPAVPVSALLTHRLSEQEALAMAMTAGDDYELLFTVPHEHEQSVMAISLELDVPIHCIGTMTSGSHVICKDAQGAEISFEKDGYQHF